MASEPAKMKCPRVWGARRYDVSKACAWLRDVGYRLVGHVIVIGPLAIGVAWKEKR